MALLTHFCFFYRPLLNTLTTIITRYAFVSNTVIKWAPWTRVGFIVWTGFILILASFVWGLRFCPTLALAAPLGQVIRISDIILGGGLVIDLYFIYSLLILLITTFFLVIPSMTLKERKLKLTSSGKLDFVALVVFSFIFGLIVLHSVNFISFYSAIEGLSLATFFGISRHRLQAGAKELFLKYFCLSSFSSVLLAAGISLLYVITQTLDFGTIKLFLFFHKQTLWADYDYLSSTLSPSTVILYVSISFIMISFLFKLGAFPFHFLVPELYQATPLVFLIFYNFVLKLIYLFTLFILVLFLFSDWAVTIAPIFMVSGIGSLIVGSLAALVQHNVWRLLGYASIAQTGLILLGLAKMQHITTLATTSFFLGYLVATLGIFFVTLTMSNNTVTNRSCEGIKFYSVSALDDNFLQLKRHSGLFVQPLAVFVFSICSFAALPPFIGFVTKYMLLAHFVRTDSLYIVGLVVILNMLSTYYYLRIVERSTKSLQEVFFTQVSRARQPKSIWLIDQGIIDLGGRPHQPVFVSARKFRFWPFYFLCFCTLFLGAPLYLNATVLTLSQFFFTLVF